MKKLIIVILILLLTTTGCIRFVTSPDYNDYKDPIASNNTPTNPVIMSFTASPESILVGEQSTLSWNVLGATSVFLEPGIGTVDSTGSQSVSPDATITYTLTAINNVGSVTGTVQVNVQILEPTTGLPEINSFTANPAFVTSGGLSTLTWNISNATSASIDHAIGNVAITGTRNVNPAVTTTYTITATNTAGSRTATATVTVQAGAPAGLPVINAFSASPTSIISGGSSTLAWNISDATTITIDNGIGIAPLAIGFTSVSPSTTTTYTITAANAAGSVTASTVVIVQAALPAASIPTINSFTALPGTIVAGGSSTLSWNISDASTVTINNGVGSVASTGSTVVSPATSTSYTLMATNAVGWRSLTITVTVTSGGGGGGSPPPAAIASLEQALFNEVNAIRVSNGLAPLVRDSYMDGLARDHSVYMANLHTLSHDNFSSVRSPAIFAYFAPSATSTGENVLNRCPVDYGNAQPLAQQWYDSPPHRANMLDVNFTRTGMGIAIIDESGMECVYATQLFAAVP